MRHSVKMDVYFEALSVPYPCWASGALHTHARVRGSTVMLVTLAPIAAIHRAKAPTPARPRAPIAPRSATPALASSSSSSSPDDDERRPGVLSVALGAALALHLSALTPTALAKTVTIAIDQATLGQETCGRAGGVPGTGTYKAKCMKITGQATNPTKDPVFNADVYGIVKDQANDDVLNSGRVGSIDKLEPGVNDFSLQITVAESQPLPLKLKNFKAQGATQLLNASPNPYDDYTEFDDFGAQR